MCCFFLAALLILLKLKSTELNKTLKAKDVIYISICLALACVCSLPQTNHINHMKEWSARSLGSVIISRGGVKRVDPACAVVVRPAPELFAKLYRHLPVAQRNILPRPDIHLATKVKHQRLPHTQICFGV